METSMLYPVFEFVFDSERMNHGTKRNSIQLNTVLISKYSSFSSLANARFTLLVIHHLPSPSYASPSGIRQCSPRGLKQQGGGCS